MGLHLTYVQRQTPASITGKRRFFFEKCVKKAESAQNLSPTMTAELLDACPFLYLIAIALAAASIVAIARFDLFGLIFHFPTDRLQVFAKSLNGSAAAEGNGCDRGGGDEKNFPNFHNSVGFCGFPPIVAGSGQDSVMRGTAQ